jgi:cytochrome d ubiquinol oxidase subunit I
MMLIGIFIRKRLLDNPWYLKLMLYSIPLPFLAHTAGWVLAEVGRQPWIVYGLMRTADAVSPIAASQVAVSLVAFILVYGLLGGVGYYLIGKYARLGPDAVARPAPVHGKSLRQAAA